jgi:hypothetical protein
LVAADVKFPDPLRHGAELLLGVSRILYCVEFAACRKSAALLHLRP